MRYIDRPAKSTVDYSNVSQCFDCVLVVFMLADPTVRSLLAKHE